MTKTTKNTVKKNTTRAYTELDISVKNNKKNDVYSASNMRLFDVYTSKKNAIVYLHENIDKCVNEFHKSTIASVLNKYSATDNKNYSERDKFKYRVSVSVDTFDAFLNDIKSACKYAVSEETRTESKKSVQRTKKSTESAQNDTETQSNIESAQSAESER